MAKVPSVIKQIQEYKTQEINYAFQKSISYSQLSMYNSCPKKWSLQYRDGHKVFTSSINTVFGTAIHETIQHYINTIYNESGAAADKINLEEYFEERFRETYLKDYKSNKNIHFSNSVEMREFYDDGLAILNFVKKKRGGYFGRKGWHLVGCELPILLNPHPEFKNILYKGYLDVVLYNETYNEFKIIDIKTSGKGWDDKTKKDETKQLQLVLYKKFFSKQFGIPEENINIQFFIVKRKIWEESPYPISRIQEFTPASGKVKMNKATNTINSFIEEVFNLDGSFKTDPYQPNPGKWNCTFCPFRDRKDLCSVGVSS